MKGVPGLWHTWCRHKYTEPPAWVVACSQDTCKSKGIPVSLTVSAVVGYIQMASWGSQRSLRSSLLTGKTGFQCAEPVGLALAEGMAEADGALFSSSVSVSVRGSGHGISGAGSIKSHGSSSSPIWLAPKYVVNNSQNFFVSLPQRATVRHCRASFLRAFARPSSSTDTCRSRID